ncbi:MAG: glycine/betaine ABC transporter substrate-binding protein [Proteobacteria bacterium]|nr:MAG: glycine/betaine ABC transporter substrate-binding protein [Pseudomonadota bacterium]PIE40107.1 MAG: glycine/betaine ABC transporter substrate-binding protein [Gammaproteobacteria bacterium]
MKSHILLVLVSLLLSTASLAGDCKRVRFGVVSWTDVQVTTAIAATLLDYLGYETDTRELFVPEIYQKLGSGELDVFLGNWMPTMESIVQPYRDNNRIEVLGRNLSGAKYTLAVPSYVYDSGVKSFSDINQFKDKFKNKLHGLEKGNDGNALLHDIIARNDFSLGDFSLVELPEFLMLYQVKRHIRNREWIAFLAWAPHPMNDQFDIRYLGGGDNYFGPNLGGSAVYTNVRAGFRNDCPNVSHLLGNLKFSLKIENELMNMVLNEFAPVDRAVRDWMYRNPDTVAQWLDGVTNRRGRAVDAAKIAARMRLRGSR